MFVKPSTCRLVTASLADQIKAVCLFWWSDKPNLSQTDGSRRTWDDSQLPPAVVSSAPPASLFCHTLLLIVHQHNNTTTLCVDFGLAVGGSVEMCECVTDCRSAWSFDQQACSLDHAPCGPVTPALTANIYTAQQNLVWQDAGVITFEIGTTLTGSLTELRWSLITMPALALGSRAILGSKLPPGGHFAKVLNRFFMVANQP